MSVLEIEDKPSRAIFQFKPTEINTEVSITAFNYSVCLCLNTSAVKNIQTSAKVLVMLLFFVFGTDSILFCLWKGI